VASGEIFTDSYVIQRCPKTGVTLQLVNPLTGDLIYPTNRSLDGVNEYAFKGLLVPFLDKFIPLHPDCLLADIGGGEYSRCAVELSKRYPDIQAIINIDLIARPLKGVQKAIALAEDLTRLEMFLPHESIDFAYSSYLLPMLPRYTGNNIQIVILSALAGCMNSGGMALIHESPGYFRREYAQQLLSRGGFNRMYAYGVGDEFLVLSKFEDPTKTSVLESIGLDPIITL